MKNSVIIHISNSEFEDSAWYFPEQLIPEFITRLKALPKDPRDRAKGEMFDSYDWEHSGTHDWFMEHAKYTKGIEDADYFLDYYQAHDCATEWEEDL